MGARVREGGGLNAHGAVDRAEPPRQGRGQTPFHKNPRSRIQWGRGASLPLPKPERCSWGVRHAHHQTILLLCGRISSGSLGDDDLSPAGTRTDHRTGGAVTPPEHEREMIP